MRLTFAPATPDRWPDVERLFGPRGACGGCWCMWPRFTGPVYRTRTGEANKRTLRTLVRTSDTPPGILAYDGGTPVGWCAVAPREDFPRLERSRTLSRVDDAPVWSIVCFFVARTHRRRGVTVALLRQAVRFARTNGARIVEGYPTDTRAGSAPDAFVWMGLFPAFEEAGFAEVLRRSPTRPIMRLRVAPRRTRDG